MASPESLIEGLARHFGTSLKLENGVCALFAQDKEVAIIEIPTSGDVAILHCYLSVSPSPHLYEQMLRMNFDLADLHGCWLSLDEKKDVRLCTQLPLSQLSEMLFVQWVLGFIQQVKDTHLLLNKTAPRTAQAPAAPAGLGQSRGLTPNRAEALMGR